MEKEGPHGESVGVVMIRLVEVKQEEWRIMERQGKSFKNETAMSA